MQKKYDVTSSCDVATKELLANTSNTATLEKATIVDIFAKGDLDEIRLLVNKMDINGFNTLFVELTGTKILDAISIRPHPKEFVKILLDKSPKLMKALLNVFCYRLLVQATRATTTTRYNDADTYSVAEYKGLIALYDLLHIEVISKEKFEMMQSSMQDLFTYGEKKDGWYYTSWLDYINYREALEGALSRRDYYECDVRGTMVPDITDWERFKNKMRKEKDSPTLLQNPIAFDYALTKGWEEKVASFLQNMLRPMLQSTQAQTSLEEKTSVAPIQQSTTVQATAVQSTAAESAKPVETSLSTTSDQSKLSNWPFFSQSDATKPPPPSVSSDPVLK